MKVIDLFSGCGGLSLGFIQNGFKIVKAVEFDSSIANTYKKNHPEIEILVDDIRNIDNCNNFNKGDADIVIGGPPCQGFSMAGARIRDGFIDDDRNYLFKHFFNIVRTVKPKIFIMENVKGLMTMQGGKTFDEICNIFSDENLMNGTKYHIYHKVLKAVDLGIPQKRERLFIIGIRDTSIEFELKLKGTTQRIINKHPTFFDPVTVYDAICNMPTVTNNGDVANPVPVSAYQKYLATREATLSNHIKTNHSKVAVERMQKIANGDNFTSLDEDIKSVHSGSYGRLRWDDVAPTITTRFDTPTGGRFIHPVEHRTLTPREAARIQSFPDDFIFYGNKTSVCKQIGNAVPPKMSYFWANFVETLVTDADKISTKLI
ncbi:DNA cytosine methyltransferase [Psychrobacter sp. H8-1]|uniref:DNA cytosine methyltransferase n=1 Tax=Psychrobacter sp. H8-1 TaxID=2774129 RepID=UPI0019198802|nr:DNA cytosine methyltransferase [Psychrobacter sp. H8-1]